MNFLKGILCAACFLASFCFAGEIFAANKIYPFDSYYGIVANDAVWTCKVKINTSYQRPSNIEGKANNLPVSFDFFMSSITHSYHVLYHNGNSTLILTDVKRFLSDYAMRTSTIFSDLTVTADNALKYSVVRGCYYDNNSFGRFAFYVKPANHHNESYCMFIKVVGDLLDEQTVDHLCQETFNLVRPLIVD